MKRNKFTIQVISIVISLCLPACLHAAVGEYVGMDAAAFKAFQTRAVQAFRGLSQDPLDPMLDHTVVPVQDRVAAGLAYIGDFQQLQQTFPELNLNIETDPVFEQLHTEVKYALVHGVANPEALAVFHDARAAGYREKFLTPDEQRQLAAGYEGKVTEQRRNDLTEIIQRGVESWKSRIASIGIETKDDAVLASAVLAGPQATGLRPAGVGHSAEESDPTRILSYGEVLAITPALLRERSQNFRWENKIDDSGRQIAPTELAALKRYVEQFIRTDPRLVEKSLEREQREAASLGQPQGRLVRGLRKIVGLPLELGSKNDQEDPVTRNTMDVVENLRLAWDIINAYDIYHGTTHAFEAGLRALKIMSYDRSIKERTWDFVSHAAIRAAEPSGPALVRSDPQAIKTVFEAMANNKHLSWLVNDVDLIRLLKVAASLPPLGRPDSNQIVLIVKTAIAVTQANAFSDYGDSSDHQHALDLAKAAQEYFSTIEETEKDQYFKVLSDWLELVLKLF